MGYNPSTHLFSAIYFRGPCPSIYNDRRGPFCIFLGAGFQNVFYFHPDFLGKRFNLTTAHIFSNGLKLNHQLGN